MLRFVVLAALASGASAIEAVGPSIRSKDGNLIGTLTSPPCGGVVSRKLTSSSHMSALVVASVAIF